MSCQPGCFESRISSCDDIIIRANFPASYPLYWIIKKAGSNNIYQRLSMTDSNGDLTIPKADLPTAFLQPGNNYSIEVRSGANYLQPVLFEFGTEQFDCIIVELASFDREVDDDSEVNVIQFNDAAVPPPSGSISDGHEEFTGSTAAAIILAHIYISGSVKLYLNGVRLANSSYTETAASTITVTFTREASDEIIIDYKYL